MKSKSVDNLDLFKVRGATTPLNPSTDIERMCTPSFVNGWLQAKEWALDIETKGVNAQHEALSASHGKIALVQIAYGSRIGVFAPDDVVMREALRTRCEDKSIVIAHNAAFELGFIKADFGIQGNNFFDTMLASQILYAGLPIKHSLKAVMLRELGVELNKDEQKSDWSRELTSEQVEYAANDVRHLVELANILYEKCCDQGLQTSIEVSMGALPVYADMRLQGFKCDEPQLAKCLQVYTKAYQAKEILVCKTLGVTSIFDSAALRQALGTLTKNPKVETSVSQMGFFDDLEENQYAPLEGSGKEILNNYVAHYPIMQEILDARTLSAYLGYLQRCEATLYKGHIRGNYRQAAPKGMGRATCGSEKDEEAGTIIKDGISYVNLHNPPNPGNTSKQIQDLGLPDVRSIFIARPGKQLFILDFDGSHARIAAEITGDENFRASFRDGIDCHLAITSSLLATTGVHWEPEFIGKVRKTKTADGALATRARGTGKNCFYAWVNGAQKRKVQSTMVAGGFSDATHGDAEGIVLRLNTLFPGISEFHKKTKRSLRKTESILGLKDKYAKVTTLSGRRIYLADKKPSDKNKYGGVNPNEAFIANWMMLEAEAKCRAMGIIWKKAKVTPKWDLRIINEAHDELNIECAIEYSQEVVKFCYEAMHGSLAFWVHSIPPTENPYNFEDCIATTWADK